MMADTAGGGPQRVRQVQNRDQGGFSGAPRFAEDKDVFTINAGEVTGITIRDGDQVFVQCTDTVVRAETIVEHTFRHPRQRAGPPTCAFLGALPGMRSGIQVEHDPSIPRWVGQKRSHEPDCLMNYCANNERTQSSNIDQRPGLILPTEELPKPDQREGIQPAIGEEL